MKDVKEHLAELKAIAILEPTQENVKAYQEMQMKVVNQSEAFSKAWMMNVYMNPLVVRGKIIATYRKLHLYDAFAVKESTNVEAGTEIPALLDIGGMKVGTMTCYDVRFPELARRLVLDGAEVIVLPAAWVRGLAKEAHWEVMVTARALENTCYMVAVGECGERNIGASRVVDPLGVTIVAAGEAPALLFADLHSERVAHARKVLPVLANRRFARPEFA